MIREVWKIDLTSTDKCEQLCRLCVLYEEYLTVNLIHGTLFVDGASLLGTLALCFKKGVIIDIQCHDESVLDDFYDGISAIGAYWRNE